MICPDFYVFSSAHEVMTPFGEGQHDGKQFLVVNFVIAFGNEKGFRHKGDWSPLPMLLLTKHRSDRSFTGVGFNHERIGLVRNG